MKSKQCDGSEIMFDKNWINNIKMKKKDSPSSDEMLYKFTGLCAGCKMEIHYSFVDEKDYLIARDSFYFCPSCTSLERPTDKATTCDHGLPIACGKCASGWCFCLAKEDDSIRCPGCRDLKVGLRMESSGNYEDYGMLIDGNSSGPLSEPEYMRGIDRCVREITRAVNDGLLGSSDGSILIQIMRAYEYEPPCKPAHVGVCDGVTYRISNVPGTIELCGCNENEEDLKYAKVIRCSRCHKELEQAGPLRFDGKVVCGPCGVQLAGCTVE